MPKIQTANESEETLFPARAVRPARRGFMPRVPWILLLLVILAGAGIAYHQHREAEKLQAQLLDLKENPQKANEEEAKVLLGKIGQLIELPSEQPTIATVSDLAPLKDQPFFAHAQVGDKVLIYSQAKKAVLYRPSTNKVIEVAPVDLDGAANADSNKNTNKNTNSNTNSSSSSNTNSNTNSNTSNSNSN